MTSKHTELSVHFKVYLKNDQIHHRSKPNVQRLKNRHQRLQAKERIRILFGTSVFDYLQIEEMQKAKRLLLETDLRLDHIAYSIGYDFVPSSTKPSKSILLTLLHIAEKVQAGNHYFSSLRVLKLGKFCSGGAVLNHFKNKSGKGTNVKNINTKYSNEHSIVKE